MIASNRGLSKYCWVSAMSFSKDRSDWVWGAASASIMAMASQYDRGLEGDGVIAYGRLSGGAPNVRPVRKCGQLIAVGPRSATPLPGEAGDDDGFGIQGCHADIGPPQLCEVVVPTNVLVEAGGGSVVLAVVVKRDLDVFPPHVGHGHPDSVFVVDRQLGLRPRKAVADDE